MRRLLVNDALSQLGEVTFWHRLRDWFGMEFVGGDYATLAEKAKDAAKDASLIVRNATWFPPIDVKTSTISLLQDIITEGPMREMQEAVLAGSVAAVFNSEFTRSKYGIVNKAYGAPESPVIPLPVDFSVFTPQNALACQQALSLPDGCVCWIGASQGAAGHVKGFDTFCQVVRTNPDIPFVAVFKDAMPESVPPNLRAYVRLTHAELVKVIGACRVGLCTSRTESQHLAGIEMGACGLPMVAPLVGVYWNRKDGEFPGLVMKEGTAVEHFATATRFCMSQPIDKPKVREYWRTEFDIPVVRAAWEKLVEEVEA